jgi:predicted enzyme related to lactoylglutathione lyase
MLLLYMLVSLLSIQRVANAGHHKPPPLAPNSLGAVGVAVSDLSISIDFYQRVLGIGLAVNGTINVPQWNQTVLAFPPGRSPTGSQIILMKYLDAPRPKDEQGKLVFYAEDVVGIVARVKAAGGVVTIDVGTAPPPLEGFATILDPDGFILELIPNSLVAGSS